MADSLNQASATGQGRVCVFRPPGLPVPKVCHKKGDCPRAWQRWGAWSLLAALDSLLKGQVHASLWDQNLSGLEGARSELGALELSGAMALTPPFCGAMPGVLAWAGHWAWLADRLHVPPGATEDDIGKGLPTPSLSMPRRPRGMSVISSLQLLFPSDHLQEFSQQVPAPSCPSLGGRAGGVFTVIPMSDSGTCRPQLAPGAVSTTARDRPFLKGPIVILPTLQMRKPRSRAVRAGPQRHLGSKRLQSSVAMRSLNTFEDLALNVLSTASGTEPPRPAL